MPAFAKQIPGEGTTWQGDVTRQARTNLKLQTAGWRSNLSHYVYLPVPSLCLSFPSRSARTRKGKRTPVCRPSSLTLSLSLSLCVTLSLTLSLYICLYFSVSLSLSINRDAEQSHPDFSFLRNRSWQAHVEVTFQPQRPNRAHKKVSAKHPQT